MARRLLLFAALLLPMALGAPTAMAASPSERLREKVTLDGVFGHLEAFQAIADQNDGTRASGTPGYDRSAEYVFGKLEAAGYEVRYQEFTFKSFRVTGPTVLQQTAPGAVTYRDEVDFAIMGYSGSGDVTAPVVAVDLNLTPPRASTSACEASDFAGFAPGSIALVQRGTCTFTTKAENAQAAGAIGVVIMNQGSTGRLALLQGTLGPEATTTIPVVGTTYALGETLAGLIGSGLRLRLHTSTTVALNLTRNVIADSRSGSPDNVVLAGAHLDSVPEGPGINDNGSGSAAILEVALQLAEEFDVNDEAGGALPNRVRFAWWGAEESGLLGSDYYVAQLSESELDDISVYLNFDMVGSPNFARFVYDGDGSAFGLAGPAGSDVIERVFVTYFASQGLASEPSEFSGRSDYRAFINAGIPSGGLFTGAEGIKTAVQARLFGGTAGIAYDPNYHMAGDTIANVNPIVLHQNADAIAHAVTTFATGGPGPEGDVDDGDDDEGGTDEG